LRIATVSVKSFQRFSRPRAVAARLAVLDGAVGAVYAPGGTPRVALEFAIDGGRIVGISVVADPESVRSLEIAMLDQIAMLDD
jgi:RNA polymerase sigma-70 factor (ECF subfamily)